MNGIDDLTTSGQLGPKLPPAESIPRELTRDERAGIKKLVVSMCANYDKEYGCLPLDCDCVMLNKWWTGGGCKYFKNAVLPLDPILEASLTGREAPAQDLCAACGKPFIADGRKAYCSPACAGQAQRKQQRDYMRKKRANVEK